MTAEVKRAETSIADKKREIAVEEAKLQQDKQAEQEERRQKIEINKASTRIAEGRLSDINDQIRTLDAEKGTLRQALADAKALADSTAADMQNCGHRLDELKQQSFSRVSVFGHNMAQLRQRIASMRWHGQTPVGPLGLFVTLKDASDQQWADVMRIALGRMMSSFAVTDARDREPLHKLLVESRKQVISYGLDEV